MSRFQRTLMDWEHSWWFTMCRVEFCCFQCFINTEAEKTGWYYLTLLFQGRRKLLFGFTFFSLSLSFWLVFWLHHGQSDQESQACAKKEASNSKWTPNLCLQSNINKILTTQLLIKLFALLTRLSRLQWFLLEQLVETQNSTFESIRIHSLLPVFMEVGDQGPIAWLRCTLRV